jgi:serine/threonine-protein kinase
VARELFRPVPVDRHQVVYRVDIAELGWRREVLKSTGEGRSLNAWDLMLLEYPYGVTQPDDAVFRALVREYLVPSGVARPVVCVRADWFVGAALQPPLYHELLFLPRTLAKLEEGLGVKAQENVDNLKAVRAGVIKSGVSQHNRVVERHTSSYGGYYWRSYDFKSSSGSRNILADPVRLQPDGGEMIFSLPNGMQAYLIVDGQGRRIDSAPQEVVTDKNAADKAVRNGLACMRCHDRGMQRDFKDVVRPTVEGLSGVAFDKEDAVAVPRLV